MSENRYAIKFTWYASSVNFLTFIYARKKFSLSFDEREKVQLEDIDQEIGSFIKGKILHFCNISLIFVEPLVLKDSGRAIFVPIFVTISYNLPSSAPLRFLRWAVEVP